MVQEFVRSDYDWRVGVLGGKALFVCRYVIPKRRWKIMTYADNGSVVYGRVQAFDLNQVDPRLLETAVDAANAIGRGLYGVDLKQVGDRFVVIEVNDNPTIERGGEDRRAPDLYRRLVDYLVGPWD